MNSASLVVLGGISTLSLVLLGVVLAASISHRRRTREELAASRADVEKLRARLDGLTRDLERARRRPAGASVVPRTEYVITGVSTGSTGGLGSTGGMGSRDRVGSADSLVLSAALGEPLVKLVAFGYGVRRALSAESRNRIAFEMRREVRRSRKQRRRQEKEAVRAARAAEREALAEGDAA
jgi:hypothetical protein